MATATPAAADHAALPPGSLRWHAVLFSGAPDRSLLAALHAFDTELWRIVDGQSHEAAHARLQWWRGELDRLAAGHPSHPLGQALLPLRNHPGTDLALLHERLVGADLDLARLTYLTWQELDAYLFRSSGALQVLIATTLTGDRELTAGERDFARRLGAAVRQADLLQWMKRDLARGRLYAPLQALEAAGIDPQAVSRRTELLTASNFAREWRRRVRVELEALPSLLTDPGERSAQRHGLVLAALHARQLERDEVAITGRAELAPFARLWTAWRVAMRNR
jgi:phytoene synthase